MWSDHFSYKDYNEYLQSGAWSELRTYFYEHCGAYKCGICDATHDLRLHHRRYEYVTLKDVYRHYWFSFVVRHYLKNTMTWLCDDCHHNVHFKNGVKIPITYQTLYAREKHLRRIYRVKRFFALLWSRVTVIVVITL